MSFLLALRLVTSPVRGWSDLSVACRSEDGLPPPAVMGGVAALMSVGASCVGAALMSHTSVQKVVVWTLAAVAGYFGSVASALSISADRLRVPPESADLVPRFVASSALPLAASGLFNFVPLPGLTVVWTVTAFALTAHTAWVGAQAIFGFEGEARTRAATTVAVYSVAPILFPLCFRVLFER